MEVKGIYYIKIADKSICGKIILNNIIMFRILFFIGAGSFVGGIARYLLSHAVQTNIASGFPCGTMVVNVLGCFIIGLLYGLFERGNFMNGDLRMFLTTGFCGGFITFSTFMHENYTLISDENFIQFSLYSLLSFGLGLLAAHLGHVIIRMV